MNWHNTKQNDDDDDEEEGRGRWKERPASCGNSKFLNLKPARTEREWGENRREMPKIRRFGTARDSDYEKKAAAFFIHHALNLCSITSELEQRTLLR